MTVADQATAAKAGAPAHGAPLATFLANISVLSRQDDYAGIAKAFAGFTAAHPAVRFLASEPVPARLAEHIVTKTGAPAAFMTYTLQHPTWAEDIKRALGDPAQFAAKAHAIEAEVQTNAAAAKPH
ncbi:MAG TPA: hypothetical protein VLA00_10400 [Xanthobacteraceae bacterium]|nr:hypothetical protein [Xanthobacteraceae bacterium]